MIRIRIRICICIRKGQAPDALSRADFGDRFQRRYVDPAYRPEQAAIDRLEAIAWQALQDGRKAPSTRLAGCGFADPSYPVSTEWLDTRKRLKAAQKQWSDHSVRLRILLVCGMRATTAAAPARSPRPGA